VFESTKTSKPKKTVDKLDDVIKLFESTKSINTCTVFSHSVSTNPTVTNNDENEILVNLGDRLAKAPWNPVVPTKAIDIFFCQIEEKSDVQELRDEYFQKGNRTLYDPKLKKLLSCQTEGPFDAFSDVFGVACWDLGGRRGAITKTKDTNKKLSRLLLGDAWFAMCYEELGCFEIFGALVDIYSSNKDARIPGNDLTGMQLEAFSQMVKRGYYPTSRQRSSCYLKLLSMLPPQLRANDKPDVKKNSSFSKLFPQLINQCLLYFRERRVVDVIQSTSASSGSSSTVTDIRNSAKLLFLDEDLLTSGNSYKTLHDILVYLVGIIDLSRNTRDAVGIPAAKDKISEFIPALYGKLVKNDDRSEPNRFLLYSQLASKGRDILIAFEAVDKDSNEDVTNLLSAMESDIEEFNNAYRTLYDVDLSGKDSQTSSEVSFVHTI